MLWDYLEPEDFPSFLYVSQILQAEAIKIGAEHLRRIRPRAMGSLYWQLNDCWPVASWAGIDYFGRWKALQYYARRFYAPLLVSPHEENGNVSVYVISDLTTSTNASLSITLMDMRGRVLRTSTEQIQVPALSSKVYFNAAREEYMNSAGADPANTFVFVELVVNGKNISSNVLYFVPPKTLDLGHPQITSELSARGNGYRLTLKSDVLARNVQISFGDVDANVSDDYFDLLPGRVVDLEVTSK